ncbi:MAG: Kdo hydroxylase family protein [Verrucomicrobiota bacterium]|nr:Kdo hydroxylase family protein [Verrucomicrobiota bacterium]
MTTQITITGEEDKLFACRELEKGNLLFFPTVPFSFPQEEIAFLLEQKQGSSRSRKNVAYKPGLDRITNCETKDLLVQERLKGVLRAYSTRVTSFLTELLSPYAASWRVDYTSFRPFQEKGRKLRVRARNDLLHFDAFPTRPLHGDRILRFFTNINPIEARHWITSDTFSPVAKRYAGNDLPLPKRVDYSWKGKLSRGCLQAVRSLGVKVPMRSPYDHFMLRFHNFLKENQSFQEETPKQHWHFPPGSCWAVFTDQVSHAALSGQYALEQTFLVPVRSLLFPENSPLHVLERLAGGNLVRHS